MVKWEIIIICCECGKKAGPQRLTEEIEVRSGLRACIVKIYFCSSVCRNSLRKRKGKTVLDLLESLFAGDSVDHRLTLVIQNQ